MRREFKIKLNILVLGINNSREYCTFSDSSVVTLKSPTWLKYTQLGTIFQNKIMFYYQTFFPLQICSSLDCS